MKQRLCRTALIAAALTIAGSAQCQDLSNLSNEKIAAFLTTEIVLHRASEICLQYKFDHAKHMNYPEILRYARGRLGDAAVDAALEKQNSMISDLLVHDQKEQFCDVTQIEDSSWAEYNK